MDYNTTEEIIIMLLSWDIRSALGHQKVIHCILLFHRKMFIECTLALHVRKYLCYMSGLLVLRLIMLQ